MATYSSSNNSGYPIGVSLLVMLCVSLYIFDTFENGYLTKLKIESQRYFRGMYHAPVSTYTVHLYFTQLFASVAYNG